MKPKAETPKPAEWGLLRAWAAQKGVSQADIIALYGTHNTDFTREQLAQNTASYSRKLNAEVRNRQPK